MAERRNGGTAEWRNGGMVRPDTQPCVTAHQPAGTAILFWSLSGGGKPRTIQLIYRNDCSFYFTYIFCVFVIIATKYIGSASSLLFWWAPGISFSTRSCFWETTLINEDIIQDIIQDIMEHNPQAIMNSEVYTIPVVFHVIHKGERQMLARKDTDIW